MPKPSPSNLTSGEQKAALESTAIRYLSYRPRFKAEVINRLARKAKDLGLTESFTLINQIVDSLEKSGFLDDRKNLESYIRVRLQEKFKGPYWIKPHLLHLGLSKFDVENALREYASRPVQLEVLRRFLDRKGHGKTLDLKEKAKFFRSLLSRGFGRDLIAHIFDQNRHLE